jgi:hypothetical protein
LELLQTPPPPLSGAQRLLFWITAAAVAVTRIPAISLTLWDWDEALFSLAVREYDVVAHNPHPPGFPLYIALAKVINLFVRDEFRAVQSIVVASSCVLFPLLFWLGREARLSFTTSWLGALLTMFLPNVWMYGGTAFSDVPGLALTVAASAMLLRGCRDGRSYLFGALLLGCAAAIRPQAMMVGALPALLSTWCRARVSWRQLVAAAAAGAAVLITAYGSAALASHSVSGYLQTARNLRDYLRKVDSFLNPDRPPLPTLLDDFFVISVSGPRPLVLALAIAAGLGLVAAAVRRRGGPFIIAGMFLPFAAFAWVMLDILSISRYAVSFAPMYGLLAAEGAGVIALIAGRYAAAVSTLMVVTMAGIFGAWTWPSLETVHRGVSPPVAAIEWTARNVDRSATVYFTGSMYPFASYFTLPQKEEPWPKGIRAEPFGARDVLITEAASPLSSARNFHRGRDRLFQLVRQRYFEVSVAPASSVATFGDGWYEEESWGLQWWKWMGGRTSTYFPPPVAGNAARLTIAGEFPTELVPRRPTFEVRINGGLVDRFVVTNQFISKSWVVPVAGNRATELVISLDKVINPAKEGINPDTRDLGFRLTSYGWEALGP